MKEKRKTRLDKAAGSGKAQFIGFSAFASETAASSPANSNTSSALQWSPVYTGPSEAFQLLFPRIGQKRDATTKAKALQELQQQLTTDDIPKKLQVEALLHWAWLYHSKLFYDSSASVRAESLQVWVVARQRLPKALSTLVNQHDELLGMVYTAQVDPAAEVRAVASSSSAQELYSQQPDWPWQEGILAYTNRILGYGRASVMHEALWSRKSSSNNADSGATSDLTEQQRDALEERFERIVGTTLETMDLYIRTNPDITFANDESQVWWKTLQTNKTSLRRKTYQLLATVCAKQPTLVPVDMSTSLAQAVSSEKEAINLPILLETVLAYIVHKDGTAAELLTKPLKKVFSKALYGARVQQWGPTLLPLVAQFPKPVPILTSLWDGRALTLGATDRWHLLTATAECCAFLLLRRNENVALSKESSRSIAQLWLDLFHETLSKSSSALRGAMASAFDGLIQELAKNLVDLEDAHSRENCAFYPLQDWFWNEGVDISNSEPSALSDLVEAVQARRKSEIECPLVGGLRDYFVKILARYQDSSGAVPSDEAYTLFHVILDFAGPVAILVEDGSFERFVMNDLLRWLIIHTSEISTQPQTKEFVEQDFHLLQICLLAREEKRSILWCSVLREIVAAKCDLEWLTVGLHVLLELDGAEEWLPCDSLDKFAVEVGQKSVDDLPLNPVDSNDEDSVSTSGDYEGYRKTLRFLRVCVGLNEPSSVVLVHRSVLVSWVEHACLNPLVQPEKPKRPSPLLEVLLQLAHRDTPMLGTEEIDLILMESWRQGGLLYVEYGVDLLNRDCSIFSRFIIEASTELRNQLDAMCSHSDLNYVARVASVWAERAYSLLQAYENSSDKASETSLSLIGLAAIDLWKACPEAAFLSCLSLLQKIDYITDRVKLIQDADQEVAGLIVAILLSLSEASSDSLAAARTKTRQDRCAIFLTMLGGKDLAFDLVEGWARAVVSDVSAAAKLPESNVKEERMRKGIAVISLLVDLCFCPIIPQGSEELPPTDVHEGSSLWYIADPQNPECKELAHVAKVHFDAQAGYYFTVQLKRDGEVQERQTVVERLRRVQSNSEEYAVSFQSLSSEAQENRATFSRLLLEDLIEPQILTAPSSTSIAELVSVVATRVGLGGDRGLGTVHYEVMKLLNCVEETFRSALSRREPHVVTDTATKMTQALGFGLNTPTSEWGFRVLKLNPIPSFRSILEFYREATIGTDALVDNAILSWIAASIPSAEPDNGETRVVVFRVATLGMKLATQVLKTETGFTGSAMCATSAIQHCLQLPSLQSDSNQIVEPEIFDDSQDAEKEALSALVVSFATVWENEGRTRPEAIILDTISESSYPEWRKFSSFPLLVERSHKFMGMRVLLASVGRSTNAESLSKALFAHSKCYYALHILDIVAGGGNPLKTHEGLSFDSETSRRLQVWSEGLELEEAEELEEDVDIVGLWLPNFVMHELETWHEKGLDELEDAEATGRLLVWLCVLRLIDAAAPKDFRNRPAFVSYLSKCDAVGPILNLALLHNEALNDGKGKKASSLVDMNDLLKDESNMTLANLASLALFRTVEVLPSLSRRWWDEECPRVYTSAMQTFVEKHVAPEILQRELNRIKAATTFGAMNVTASLVSREVTATYLQDDFTLTVLIRVPAAFPFRSAEVDCSKTLGIPQSRWKRWSLQITLMLNNQGGTLQDALMLWKDNVDKEFEGVEPCPVCYSVLHVKTHKLPALECKTCRNRFHTDCLIQWFRSSGKNQCVLCQQPWQGTRIQ